MNQSRPMRLRRDGWGLVVFALVFGLFVLVGPNLLLMLSWIVAVLLIAVSALVIVIRFLFQRPRAKRANSWREFATAHGSRHLAYIQISRSTRPWCLTS